MLISLIWGVACQPAKVVLNGVEESELLIEEAETSEDLQEESEDAESIEDQDDQNEEPGESGELEEPAEEAEEEEPEEEDESWGDSDGDGIIDVLEDEIGSDPNNADTDGDGLSDGEELEAGLDYTNEDTDGDGISDGDEVNEYGTDPTNSDTDDDGISDGDELAQGTDPLTEEMDEEEETEEEETEDDPADWEWGEPELELIAFAQDYAIDFTMENTNTGYLLCEETAIATVNPDGSIVLPISCTTPNGSVLEIEHEMSITSTTSYNNSAPYQPSYVAYTQGTVYVTVPSGQVFTATTQGQIYLNIYYYSSTQPYDYFSQSWQIQINTPSGLRSYSGQIYGVY